MKTTVYIMTVRQNNLPKKERMTMNKDLLAPKEITRAELKALVDEWEAKGNKITQCAEGVALNFRTPDTPKVTRPKHLRKPRKIKAATKKKKK